MKKLMTNVLLLNVLAAPCLLMFNDVDPVTEDWDWTLNLIGAVYCIWFYHQILKPAFEPKR